MSNAVAYNFSLVPTPVLIEAAAVFALSLAARATTLTRIRTGDPPHGSRIESAYRHCHV